MAGPFGNVVGSKAGDVSQKSLIQEGPCMQADDLGLGPKVMRALVKGGGVKIRSAAYCFRKARGRTCLQWGDCTTAPWASASLLVRGHSHPSYEHDIQDTEKVEREEEKGLRREEDSGPVFWETSLVSGLLFYSIGMLEWKFTLNPSLTS